jgi:hypothetical protein
MTVPTKRLSFSGQELDGVADPDGLLVNGWILA